MADLEHKIKNALNEARILVLVGQVLVGFELQSVFREGFERVPAASRFLTLASTTLLLVALALLMVPAAHHRIVERGEDTESFHALVTSLLAPVLALFALSIGADFFIIAERIAGARKAAFAAGALTGVALFFWYGIELMRRRWHARHPHAHAS